MTRPRRLLLALLIATLLPGCRLFQPATLFAVRMELGLGVEKPHNWSRIKELAMRPAPSVGTAAPDFVLPSLESGEALQRSRYQAGRPLVLVFGSYT